MKRLFGCFVCIIFSIAVCCGNVVAENCLAGFGIGNDGTCVQCQSGYYSVGGEDAQCSTCAAGTYSGSMAATSCSTCSAGTYSGAGAASCTKCAAGTYSGSGATECLPCAEGYYSGVGASSCSQCEAGRYIEDGECKDCPAGTYSTEPGAISCTQCEPRTYSEDGATSCSPCPAGSCCAQGIRYSCLKGTWSPGNELCYATAYNIVEQCATNDRGTGGTRGADTGNTGGGSSGGGSGGGMCSLTDMSTYHKGVCLHECRPSCTTASIGAKSESECVVKTVKTFRYNNTRTFSWPKDSSVTVQPIKTSSGINFETISCP